MGVVITTKLQVSCLGGLQLPFISIRKKVSQQESSSRTERTPKDASRSSRRTPAESRWIQITITWTRLTNSIVFTVVTSSTKNFRTHGPLTTSPSQTVSKRLNQGLLTDLTECWIYSCLWLFFTISLYQAIFVFLLFQNLLKNVILQKN